MKFDDALRDLNLRRPESMPEPSLDRIRALAEQLDHPELTYPSIHITGTNGKTTTARIITALACAHGLTTGTFISPHVESVTERLSVCDAPISEGEFGEEYERLLPFLERIDESGHPVTYFEALTALAYLWFADKPVGLGVFEVGMGGTWDATNLIRGDVAVICPIGLDHVQYLGPTVADIATEKAGIVKGEGRYAIVREQPPEALEVIERRARQVGAHLVLEGEAFEVRSRAPAVGGQQFTPQGLHGDYESLFMPLHGEEAARNAVAAIAACEALLGRALDQKALEAALGGATSPGRVEVVGRHPLTILDGAHNPDAALVLASTLREAFRWRQLHLVVGMFEDKDVEEFCRILAPVADSAYACRSTSPRAASPERVAGALRKAGGMDVATFGSTPEAVAAARAAAAEGDLIVVTGSFYTVGEARPLFAAA
jgi:dihydrofolate synthase/folylpolyglutamate synthase